MSDLRNSMADLVNDNLRDELKDLRAQLATEREAHEATQHDLEDANMVLPGNGRLSVRIAELQNALATETRKHEEAERVRGYYEQHWELDQILPEEEQISAAFPTRSGNHERFAEAMRLVHAKHSKYGLTSLVNWLLSERDAALKRAEEAETITRKHATDLQTTEAAWAEVCEERDELRAKLTRAVEHSTEMESRAWAADAKLSTARKEALELAAKRLEDLQGGYSLAAETVRALSEPTREEKRAAAMDKLRSMPPFPDSVLAVSSKLATRASEPEKVPSGETEAQGFTRQAWEYALGVGPPGLPLPPLTTEVDPPDEPAVPGGKEETQ